MKTRLALATAFGLVAVVLPGTSSAAQTELVRYKGELVADDSSAVEFVVRMKNDRPRSGEFTARNFTIFCDNEFFLYKRFEMRVRFFGHRFFEGDDWEINSLGGKEFYEVQGRLESRRRRARGSLLIFTNPSDPDQPECNSGGGRGFWEAKRPSQAPLLHRFND